MTQFNSEEYVVYHVQTIINSPASEALVTAYGPTPSYDMIQKDSAGPTCVIDGVRAHQRRL